MHQYFWDQCVVAVLMMPLPRYGACTDNALRLWKRNRLRKNWADASKNAEKCRFFISEDDICLPRRLDQVSRDLKS
ncbi:hypothetical protein RSSM_03099 [Rhodopirellula sallentina SM41]|uniref:Uncharacterized protein n=1 Tax=Rhodopirellula sallentina SM41 TaxID=1263870 RepID=M5UC73_9BACT|nr:hypothetical protein RSSM_03099 [Rhodopirellula sallentina SM41]